jgi:Fic family protein
MSAAKKHYDKLEASAEWQRGEALTKGLVKKICQVSEAVALEMLKDYVERGVLKKDPAAGSMRYLRKSLTRDLITRRWDRELLRRLEGQLA